MVEFNRIKGPDFELGTAVRAVHDLASLDVRFKDDVRVAIKTLGHEISNHCQKNPPTSNWSRRVF